jgi:hypothetical protein
MTITDETDRTLVASALDNIRTARAFKPGVWPAGTLEQADALLSQALGETEPAAAQDEDWADLLSGAEGIAGQQKWFPNSTGCDIFVRRGTEVRAPHDCAVSFRPVAGGPMPIGEMLLIYSDGRVVRFRHVATRVGNNAQARQGDVVAIVWDPSMDLLNWPPGYPTPPDGYQHLDISLATSAARLNPEGGAGGDVDADAHIFQQGGGIPNIQLFTRTPGPIEGSQVPHLAAWQAWLTRS